MAVNAVLYAQGLFQETQFEKVTRTYAQQMQDLQQAQYTTLLLWAIHVESNGDLMFNDALAASGGKVTFGNPPGKLNPQLPGMLAQLKKTSTVDLVLASCADSTSYENMSKNWAVTIANFRALAQALPLDGVDVDFEPDGYSSADQALVVGLTVRLAKAGVRTTYCPYTMEQWWLECAEKVFGVLRAQPVRWMNVQCYDGGEGNDPADWVKSVTTYPMSKLGVSDAAAFVVPGYWSRIPARYPKQPTTSCPSVVEQKVAAAHSAGGISGAFIYNSHDIYAYANPPLCGNDDFSLAGYSSAIVKGAGG